MSESSLTKRKRSPSPSRTQRRSPSGTQRRSPKKTKTIKTKYWIEPISEISIGSKAIYKLVSTEELGDWAKDYGFPFPNNPEDYIIFQFKDDEHHVFDYNDVYNELSLQYKLSVKGFMPKIVLCVSEGPINPTVHSFPNFIKSVEKKNKIPKEMRYIVEKVMCGTDLLAIYGGNYSKYFSDIKELFYRLAEEEGIMLLDMKPEHLCKNKSDELCFIDADAYFVTKIGKTEIDTAVTYMMFQIYAILNANKYNIDIKATGITEKEYTDMMKYIVGLQIKYDCSKEYVKKYSPLEMLIRYSKMASDSSTDIMSEIKHFYNPSLFHNFCRNYAPVLLPILYHIKDQFKRVNIIIGDFQ
jgi:hypothetical protein